MVDLIADKVLFNLENNLSGSAVITGNVVRVSAIYGHSGKFSANHALWSEFCRPRPLERKWPSPMLQPRSATASHVGHSSIYYCSPSCIIYPLMIHFTSSALPRILFHHSFIYRSQWRLVGKFTGGACYGSIKSDFFLCV